MSAEDRNQNNEETPAKAHKSDCPRTRHLHLAAVEPLIEADSRAWEERPPEPKAREQRHPRDFTCAHITAEATCRLTRLKISDRET